MMYRTMREVAEEINKEGKYGVEDIVNYKNGLPNGALKVVAVDGKKLSICPVIYKANEMEKEMLMDTIKKALENKFDVENIQEIFKYEYIMENVRTKLLPGGYYKDEIDNRDYATTKIETNYMEFYEIYQVPVSENENGNAIVSLTWNMIEKYGYDIEEIREAARSNAYSKLRIKPMSSILGELMGNENIESCDELDSKMYVLTTENMTNGACYLADKDALNYVSKALKWEKYLILPSSIHELIIIQDNEEENYEELKNMVKFINDTEVRPEERLSYTIFKYDAVMNSVFVV